MRKSVLTCIFCFAIVLFSFTFTDTVTPWNGHVSAFAHIYARDLWGEPGIEVVSYASVQTKRNESEYGVYTLGVEIEGVGPTYVEDVEWVGYLPLTSQIQRSRFYWRSPNEIDAGAYADVVDWGNFAVDSDWEYWYDDRDF